MDSQYITESTVNSEKTAARFPINRTYTQEQTIIANDYVFHTPSDWFSSRSPGKCIGLREARLIPWHGVFSIPLVISDEEHFFEYTAIFRENEDIHDFIRSLERQVQAYLNKNFAGALLLTSYDNGEFRMKFVDKDYNTMAFAIVFDRYDDEYKEEHINNFLAALNQPKTFDREIFDTWMEEFKVNNVWDRKHLYIHSSISTDYNQILCENYSSYDDPRSYLFPCAQPTIKIWFTTDTKNIIKIHSCLFVLKLCFVFNYKNAVM